MNTTLTHSFSATDQLLACVATASHHALTEWARLSLLPSAVPACSMSLQALLVNGPPAVSGGGACGSGCMWAEADLGGGSVVGVPVEPSAYLMTLCLLACRQMLLTCAVFR
jgi:hypothetical protein